MHFSSTASRLQPRCVCSWGSVGYNRRMTRPAARVPGIERLELPEVRQAIPRLHAYLRECILDGRLPPGTKLSQVALASQLGVSRTPLREVLRMLQDEGYVEFEPNQRMRVADLDPVELDADYACRIVLETLALSMTLESIGSRQRREARRLLTAMRRAARIGDFPGRGSRSCASSSRWRTAACATSGSTSSPSRPAGRPPATSSTRRSWTRWRPGTTTRPSPGWPTTWPAPPCGCSRTARPATRRAPSPTPSPSPRAPTPPRCARRPRASPVFRTASGHV